MHSTHTHMTQDGLSDEVKKALMDLQEVPPTTMQT